MRGFALSVPANLLLLGEYAVLEEGGLGVALAAAPRLRVRVEPSRDFSIRSLMGASERLWTESSGEEAPPLLAACLAETRRYLAEAGLRPRFGAGGQGLAIELDSTEFFAADGSKRGLGSSAAVAVGLVAALLRAGGLVGNLAALLAGGHRGNAGGGSLEAAVFPVALAAHRRAQGGRGSGYDIAASRYGGLGAFRGGDSPSWTALDAPSLPRLLLLAGRRPVSSASAVESYLRWRETRPEDHRRFLERSRAAVEGFLAASSTEEACRALSQAAAVGLELGEAIGVPARLDRPAGLSEEPVLKALGAGDELGLLALASPLPSPPTCPPILGPVVVETEGLRWE